MNKTLTVPQKEVPVLLECDVLVVGAGVSGFAAAVSASRAGANVVLAEKNHFPGGVATSGLMCSISNYFCTRNGTQITTGLPIEFLDRLVREGGTMADYLRPTQPQIPNDPEIPLLLNQVYPCHEVVKIDYHLPGCPPSADTFWEVLTSLLSDKPVELPYQLVKYD